VTTAGRAGCAVALLIALLIALFSPASQHGAWVWGAAEPARLLPAVQPLLRLCSSLPLWTVLTGRWSKQCHHTFGQRVLLKGKAMTRECPRITSLSVLSGCGLQLRLPVGGAPKGKTKTAGACCKLIRTPHGAAQRASLH